MTQAADATAPALLAQRFVEAFNARDQQALCKLYHPTPGSSGRPGHARVMWRRPWRRSADLFNGQEIPATGRPPYLGGTIFLAVDEQGLIIGERQYWEVYPLVEFWMAVGVIGSWLPAPPPGAPVVAGRTAATRPRVQRAASVA
jgi:hypothetical protein